MDIYLIRHAQGEHNLLTDRIWGHSPQMQLTEQGTQESIALHRFFAQFEKPYTLFASTAIRAQETGTIGTNGTKPNIREAFNEISRGSFEGAYVADTPDEFKQGWKTDRILTKLPGGENYVEAATRFKVGLELVVQAHNSDEPIFIVTHGNVMKAFYFGMLANQWNLLYDERTQIPNTGIIKVRWDGKFLAPTQIQYPVYSVDHLK